MAHRKASMHNYELSMNVFYTKSSFILSSNCYLHFCLSLLIISLPALCFAVFKYILVILSHPLSQHQQTDLREICRICRSLVVDERSKVIFFDPSRDVAVVPILWTKSISFPRLVVRMTFARSAPPSRSRDGVLLIEVFYSYRSVSATYAHLLHAVGRMQINYLIRWMQASQLADELTIN